jgi:sulfate permease, SulP family
VKNYFATLLQELSPDFSWRKIVDARRELIAGLTGALLVIPQAITFAYLAGMQPVHGIYCAVFVGFISSLFGNSPLIGGPNTAVSILLGLTAIQFAGSGSPLYIEFVFALSLLVGLIQLAIWLLRGATLFRFFSPAAISGIKVGIGVLLITSALEGALGLSPLSTQFFYEKFYLALASWHELLNPYAVTISAITIASGLALKKIWPRTYIVAAITIGSLVGIFCCKLNGPISAHIEVLGHVKMEAFPFSALKLGPPHWLFLEHAFPSAVAIAVLGLAQSLVIARDLKASVSNELDLHKEVFAQGVANIAAPFFSAFAGSGSFNRTSVAVEMGSRSPLTGLISAAAVILIAYALGPFLTNLPMPAVAGVLALVGIGMIQSEMKPIGHWVERTVLGITLFSVLFLGLEIGIFVAVAASVVFFVASASKLNFSVAQESGNEHIVVSGNLFYASFDRLAKHLRTSPAATTVLDLSRVAYCDAAARNMLRKIQAERARLGGHLDVGFPD